MPAQVRQAMFQPISPNLNLKKLVEETPNFQYVVRINCESIEEQGAETFEKLVLLHVILGGKPLVLEGYQKSLPTHLFSPSWLDLNLGTTYMPSRDLINQKNMDFSVTHYLKNMPKLTHQFEEHTYREPKLQRLYLKDIDCPDAWFKYLERLIPPSLFYLNESTGDVGGPGAKEEISESFGARSMGKGVAPAGDLMSSLEPEMRAENMMCYIGHEGTFTPAHREMCASLGHNIMVEASGNGLDPWGKQEIEGSSIWFMTETKDRYLVSEYWLSILGHDIEVENHFAQMNAWINAPFTVYIVEQKVGDFILIPPLAPHQVWNRGTRTMKAAWNRTTVETLEMAMNEALPRARMVCRDEQYKNKAIVFFTMDKYANLLERIASEHEQSWSPNASSVVYNNRKVRQLRKDFRRLFYLFQRIMLSEMFFPELSNKEQKNLEYVPFDSNITCAYCRCNIFNRFLTCNTCEIKDPKNANAEPDKYDCCMECYAMGRSCGCLSKLKWVEQFHWKDLVNHYDQWRMQVIDIEGGVNENSPQTLEEARRRLGKKTLAQICQEQLRIRPWCDITKDLAEQTDPQPDDLDDDDDGEVDGDGRKKKKRRKSKKSEKWLRENSVCHICKERQPNWKMASCDCGFHYCYGVLYRAFDLMPQEVMEMPEWQCPRCLKICSCAACRKDEEIMPYEPKGTLVGHDTKRVADPRSVDALVDYSRSNLYWLNKNAPTNQEGGQPYDTVRLQRRREEAQLEKAREETLNDSYVDDDADEFGNSFAHSQDAPGSSMGSQMKQMHLPLDPQLGISTHGGGTTFWQDDGPSQSHDHPGRISLPSPSAMINGASAVYDPMDLDNYSGGAGRSSDRYQDNNVNSGADAPYESDNDSVGARSGYVAPRATYMSHEEPENSPYHSAAARAPRLSGGMYDANREFHKAQLRETLAEAKKTNSFNITQARLRGKHKVVKFAIPSNRLEDVPAKEHGAHDDHASTSILRENGTPVEDDDDMNIVRSDAPSAQPGFMQLDGEGGHGSHERGTRKNSGGRNRGKNAKRNSRGRETDSEGSDNERAATDDDEDEVQAEEEHTPGSKKRRESAWLARKNAEEPADLPTELPIPAPRRRSSTKKAVEPSPEESSEAEVDEVDENYNPIVTSSVKQGRSGSAQGSNKDAKMLALRFAVGEVSDFEDQDSASYWEEDEPEDEAPSSARKQNGGRRTSQLNSQANDSPPKASKTARRSSTTKAAPVGKKHGKEDHAVLPNSILARANMHGRKIKIVSAKNASRAPSTPATTTNGNSSGAKAAKSGSTPVSSATRKGKNSRTLDVGKVHSRRSIRGDEEDGLF